MARSDQRSCLCGAPTRADYAPGHDSLHASELALAVHSGALTDVAARALIPTPDTTARFETVLASRSSGKYRGRVHAWGAWLDDATVG